MTSHLEIPVPHYSDDPQIQSEYAEAYVESYQQGMFEERTRLAAIILAPEAKGREKTAKALALETDLPADQALALLRSMPVASSIAARQADFIIKH